MFLGEVFREGMCGENHKQCEEKNAPLYKIRQKQLRERKKKKGHLKRALAKAHRRVELLAPRSEQLKTLKVVNFQLITTPSFKSNCSLLLCV